MKKQNLTSHFSSDLSAGIVVFLVAVPLCLGIALASGAPLFSGMIAGIVGGIIIGILSNSHTSVSGPAAGLTAVVLVSIQQLGGDFYTFTLAVVLAGGFQLLIYLFKAGSLANYFPTSVIKGMLTAIGIIIILKQIPHALGYDADAEGDLTFSQSDGQNTLTEILNVIRNYIHQGALLVTLVSMSILILWESKYIPKKIKIVPGALIAVIVAILMNEFFKTLGAPWLIEKSHLVDLPVARNFNEFLGYFSTPNFSAITQLAVWKIALTLAAVASIESLLCIEAVDKLDPLKRTTNANREMLAQGVGNIASGLIGGLPVTSVIVRSSANVNSGAKSKLATIIHGTLLLVCTILIPNILNKIPLAALAAILLMIGYKLAKISLFKSMWAAGKYQFWPFIITVVAIVLTDLLTGVGIGLVAAIFSILFGNMKNAYRFHEAEYQDGDIIHIKLAQEVSFLNKAAIKKTLENLPEDSKVLIDASETAYIDYDVLEVIQDFVSAKAPEDNIKVTLKGFRDKYSELDADFVHSHHEKK